MTLSHGSRYEGVPPLLAPVDPDSGPRGISARPIATRLGALEHIWTADDRLELLANHYYGDPRKWWLILDANPDIEDAGELESAPPGTILLIPPNREGPP